MPDDLKLKYPYAHQRGIERRGYGIHWKHPVSAKTDPKDKDFVITEKGDRIPRLDASMWGITIDGKENHISVACLREVEAEGRERAEALRKDAIAQSNLASGEARLRQAEQAAKQDAYADALLALPEAEGRLKIVMKIVACHTETSLPVAQAARFLRGFRVDAERAQVDFTSRKANDDMLKRKVEIRVVALARNARADDVDARIEQKNLAYALSLVRSGQMSITAALAGVGIDPSNF